VKGGPGARFCLYLRKRRPLKNVLGPSDATDVARRPRPQHRVATRRPGGVGLGEVRRGGGEGGFSLIEVIIAITMLAGVMAATTSLVQNAVNVSRASRLRQLATDIATSMLDCAVGSIDLPQSGLAFPTPCGEQQSLLTAQGYSGLNPGVDALNSVARGGTTFYVEQQVSPGNGSCSQPSGGAPPELEVNDWVTWASNPPVTSYWWQGGVQGRYVEESTLVAVPAAALNTADGNILVKITDDSAPSNGQADVTVTVTPAGGGASQTATTTNEGCLLFTNLSPQSYNISASRTGWIDSNNDFSGGVASGLSMTGTVTAGTTVTVPYQAPLYYAQAATVTANYSLASPYSVPSNISSLPLSFYNTGMGTDPYVGPAPGASGDQVFPYPGTSYQVVAGSCVVPGNPGAPDTPDGSAATDGVGVSVTPGGSAIANFTLTPTVIVVQDTSGQLSGANVEAIPATSSGAQDAHCPTTGSTEMPSLDLPATSSAGLVDHVQFREGSQQYVLAAYWEPNDLKKVSGALQDLRPREGAKTAPLAKTAREIARHAPNSGAGLTPAYILTGSPSYTLSLSPNPSNFGQSVALKVSTTSSGEYVQYFSNGTKIGSCFAISGTSYTYSTAALPLGADSITASVYTNSACSSLSGTASAVTENVQGMTSSQNPSTYGQNVTFTAYAVSASDAVEFLDGTTEIACVAVGGNNNVTTPTVNNLPVGTDTITAKLYATSTTCSSGSTSSLPTLSQVVDAAVLSLGSNLNPSEFGQSVTLTLSGVFTGYVQFQNGGSNIGSCTAVNTATESATLTTATLPVGTDTIGAQVYLLSSSCASPAQASAPSLSQVVASNTGMSLTSSLNPSKPGDSVTFTATIAVIAPASGTPTGTVLFENNSTTLCASAPLVNQGNGVFTATCTTSSLPESTSATSNEVSATYSGDSNFSTSTSSLYETVIQYASLSGLPYGTFLICATSTASGSCLPTSSPESSARSTTATILAVAAAGITEYICTGGSYNASGYYTVGSGTCSSQLLPTDAPVFVTVK